MFSFIFNLKRLIKINSVFLLTGNQNFYFKIFNIELIQSGIKGLRGEEIFLEKIFGKKENTG